MKKVLLTTLLLLACIPNIQAQQGAADDEYLATIKEMLVVTNASATTEMLAAQMIDTYRSVYSNVPSSIFDRLQSKLCEAILDKQAVIAAKAYAKRFSLQEIKEIIKFYQSPVGSKLSLSLPEITQELYQEGAKLGEEVSQQLLQELNSYSN